MNNKESIEKVKLLDVNQETEEETLKREVLVLGRGYTGRVALATAITELSSCSKNTLLKVDDTQITEDSSEPERGLTMIRKSVNETFTIVNTYRNVENFDDIKPALSGKQARRLRRKNQRIK